MPLSLSSFSFGVPNGIRTHAAASTERRANHYTIGTIMYGARSRVPLACYTKLDKVLPDVALKLYLSNVAFNSLENGVEHGKDDGEEKCPPEIDDDKAGHDDRGQQYEKRIENNIKKAEC